MDSSGKPADFLPGDAATLSQDLRYFPWIVDNVAQWMWDVFRAEGVTPPLYNPELKAMDWHNKRLPNTDSGTDLSADPGPHMPGRSVDLVLASLPRLPDQCSGGFGVDSHGPAVLFAQHQYQNRGAGAPNVEGPAFYEMERRTRDHVQATLGNRPVGGPQLVLESAPGPKQGMPKSIKVRYEFAGEREIVSVFKNLVQGSEVSAGF